MKSRAEAEPECGLNRDREAPRAETEFPSEAQGRKGGITRLLRSAFSPCLRALLLL